jgi:hypothetical protein
MRTGNTAWGLPPYNGDLFSETALVGAELLEEATLADARFGPALAALAFDPEGEEGGVDYGDLEISHLGRIYEGLLTLRLSVADQPLIYDERADRYVPAGKKHEPAVEAGDLFYQTTSGGRKAAGVYYTPQVIVRHLVDHAVTPALDEHLERVAETADRDPRRAAEILFDFRVLDPAMGSAHFLTDALDRIAERIGTFLAEHPLKPVIKMLDDLRAEARWEGRIEDGDLFRRLVLKRCIFGVDLSGMAVEVAKVSLWLASFVPGLSLSYLGHNLRQGDALVGVADPAVLGDLGPMFALNPDAPIPQALLRARDAAARISAGLDRTPEEVEVSRAAEQEMNGITDGLVRVFDVWCAEPFGVAKARGWITGAADKVLAGEEAKGAPTYLESAEVIALDQSFLHWPAEFPEVFMRDPHEAFPTEVTDGTGRLLPGVAAGGQAGPHEVEAARPGFDVVIGNPPWDEVNVEELGFFALHDPGIRGVKSEVERRQRIEALTKRYPSLASEFDARRDDLHQRRAFFGPAGGYLMQGAGNLDLQELFTERYVSLTRTGGRLGVVLPRAAFLGVGSRGFRRWLFGSATVERIDFLLNNRSWAFPIHPQYTIALLSAKRASSSPASVIRLTGPSSSQEDFENKGKSEGVGVALGDLQRWTVLDGESSWEVPLLPNDAGARLFDLVTAGPRFDAGYIDQWSCFPIQGDLNETTHKALFKHTEGPPVWKGRSFDQYDPHGADPAGHAKDKEMLGWLQKKRTSTRSAFRGRFTPEFLADEGTQPFQSARVAFRDVSRATDSRTVRACLAPPGVFLANSAPYLVFDRGGPLETAFVLGVMNSLPFDWQARRYVEAHLNFFVLSLLRFPDPANTDTRAIGERAARLSCVDTRFVSFAEAVGVAIGTLDDKEEARLRSEIDALVARAYRLDLDDLEVVFSDFTPAAVPLEYRELVRSTLRSTRD